MLNQMCNKNVFYFTSLGGGQRRGVEDHCHIVATIGWWGAGERCGGPPSHGSNNWRVGGSGGPQSRGSNNLPVGELF